MIPGLTEFPALLAGSAQLPVQGVVLNKGLARASVPAIDLNKRIVIQLSAGTRHGVPTYNQSLVCSLSEARAWGPTRCRCT
jgi:class I fructose-bisphosphate aldolase